MVLEGASDAPATVSSAKLDDVTNPYAESVSLEQDDPFMSLSVSGRLRLAQRGIRAAK